MGTSPSAASESTYVVPEEISAEAITRSLQSLLPTRHHPIARHRFTVLDTFDGRIRRAGASLTRGGVNGHSTVEWQASGGGSRLAVRLTEPVSFAWDLPEGPLQRALAPVIGVRCLLAQTDAEEYGSLLEILDDRDKTVARLRIAAGRARLPTARSAWRPLPTMVTLTGLRGYKDAYERLVPVIESRPGVEPCPEGLLDVMLRRAGASVRGDMSSPHVELAPTVKADVGARTIHRALLSILEANEPGLRANLDTEFLHDFRVAVRRTRSLLGQIRHVFAPDVVQHFAAEFSWLGHLTGRPRDLDVLVLGLRERRGELSDADLDQLMAFLGEEQQKGHAALVSALETDRYQRLLADWRTFLERPAPMEPEAQNARRPLAETVARRAWRLSRRITDSAETIDVHTDPERLHALRIDAKKLRYLVDVMPSFGNAADLARILGALKKLQRVLGDFNDAHVQEKQLLECGRALAASGGSGGVLLALGRLAERSHQRRDQLRDRVVEKLAQFSARETRSACRRAFKKAWLQERAL